MGSVLVFAVTPPVGWLAITLAAYAFVGLPVVFWGLGRTGKRGLAWVIVPILVAITTVGLWLYAHRQVHP